MNCSRRRPRGFTLVELLVVIGIIAVLIAVLLPALTKARDQAKNIQCSARLHNMGQALLMYANENKGKIPQKPQPINWLWDVPKEVRDALVRKGQVRQLLYCPFFPDQDANELWDFPPASPVDQQFTVLGYQWLGKRPDVFNSAGVRTWGPFPVMIGRGYVETLKPPLPPAGTVPALAALYPTKSSDCEIMTDAVFTQNLAATIDVRNPQPGIWFANGGWTQIHVVPHIKKGVAQGGNVLFMDFHVAWRPMAEMRNRVTTGGIKFFF